MEPSVIGSQVIFVTLKLQEEGRVRNGRTAFDRIL